MHILPFCVPSNSLHNKLKCNPRYLAHQVNRRLDDLIHVLLKCECDLLLSLKPKEVSYISNIIPDAFTNLCMIGGHENSNRCIWVMQRDRHKKGILSDNAAVQGQIPLLSQFFHSRVVFLCFHTFLVSVLFPGPSLLALNFYRKRLMPSKIVGSKVFVW